MLSKTFQNKCSLKNPVVALIFQEYLRNFWLTSSETLVNFYVKPRVQSFMCNVSCNKTIQNVYLRHQLNCKYLFTTTNQFQKKPPILRHFWWLLRKSFLLIFFSKIKLTEQNDGQT